MYQTSTGFRRLDSARALQISENRQKLVPITKTIILCVRQEIVFRGRSNDSGLLNLNVWNYI